MSVPGGSNPLLLATAAGGAGYEIERSLRFNSSDSAYLSRTPSVAGNRKTWTWAGWVKLGALGTVRQIFTSRPTSSPYALFYIYSDDKISFADNSLNTHTTAAVYRDPSAWYHIQLAVDTTTATAANRVRLWVNGVLQTWASTTAPTQNADGQINTATAHSIGSPQPFSGSEYFSGYLADIHFIDGQALDPTSFGEFDTNGVWQPIAYAGSYGTNGFRLPFSDNSTAAALGTDTSGNGNTWTVNNISVTAGAGNDSLVDSPINGSQTDTGVGGEVVGNYATLNFIAKGTEVTLSNGNLDYSHEGSTGSCRMLSTIAMSSGKWYCEHTCTTSSYLYLVGIVLSTEGPANNYVGQTAGSYGYYAANGNKYNNSSNQVYGAPYSLNDVIGIAFDADNRTLTFYKNGVSQGTAYSSLPAGSYFFAQGNYTGTTYTGTFNFGQRPFAYTAPSGFKALCTTNLPEPTIADGSTAMDVALYTGTGGFQSITGLNFSPDFVWVKERSQGINDHVLKSSLQTKFLSSDEAYAERGNDGDLISSFDTTGFTVSTTYGGGVGNSSTNGPAVSYVAWCWDAGSSTVTNTEGSITSQVRANPSAGFSVVTWTATNSNATIGHGLGAAPSLIIVKSRDSNTNWTVYHSALGAANGLLLNLTSASSTDTNFWNNTSPTSTVFSVGSYSNYLTDGHVAYCFAPVAGYSSFGSYTGNGSADGPFVYTGFRPRWVMIKASSFVTYGNWVLHDTSRSISNVSDKNLYANASDSEDGIYLVDCLSNGFKLRSASFDGTNGSGAAYIYAAFAEHPFATSRAR